MDVTIQALVQSPYMRAMAVVPTKSEELVHGISDHLPPLVKTTVKVPPVRNAGITGVWAFNIPRRGLWHGASLVIRPEVSGTLDATISAKQYLTASTFVEAVQSVELYSKQRFIERLIPEAIVSEMLSYGSKKEQYYQCTAAKYTPDAGTFQSDPTVFPYIQYVAPISGFANVSAGQSSENNARAMPHYIIPLPFACFTSVKKNFQTQFIEPLTVCVTTKAFGYFPITGYSMELVCGYHSFHPNVESVIRNANYKQSIPATLPWHEWIQFDNRLSTSSSSVEYSLESDALISKLLIVPQYPHKASGVRTVRWNQNFYVVIRSSSQVVYEGSMAGLRTESDLVLDETESDLSDENELDEAYRFYYPITFGLRRDQERFTGGLALSSLVNARITIYPNESVYRSGTPSTDVGSQFVQSTQLYDSLDFKIIGKRHFFLRIDSDTGVITRSIEA